MYCIITLRKFVNDADDANNFLDTIRDKIEEMNEVEITAQTVCQLCHETPTPCPEEPT